MLGYKLDELNNISKKKSQIRYKFS